MEIKDGHCAELDTRINMLEDELSTLRKKYKGMKRLVLLYEELLEYKLKAVEDISTDASLAIAYGMLNGSIKAQIKLIKTKLKEMGEEFNE